MSQNEKFGPAALQGNNGFAASVALLLLRVVVGWVFIYAGGAKLFGWFTPDGKPAIEMLAAGLAKMNMPLLSPKAWAYIAAIGEFVGGVSLLLGLLTRLGTLPILVTMFVAIGKVHGAEGWKGYQYNMVLIAVATALLLTGPGLLSIDAFLFRRGFWSRGAQPLQNPGKRT